MFASFCFHQEEPDTELCKSMGETTQLGVGPWELESPVAPESFKEIHELADRCSRLIEVVASRSWRNNTNVVPCFRWLLGRISRALLALILV